MDKIVAPINPDSLPAIIGNLQAALQLCLQREAILANNQNERQQASAALAQEQPSQKYGGATSKIVSIFQGEHHVQGTGRIDETTASALNQLLQSLGAFDAPNFSPAPREFVVSGRVTGPDNSPEPKIVVRALHEGQGGAVKLGDDSTDGEGVYTIRYQPIDATPVNLNVVVFDNQGARRVQSGASIARAVEVRNLLLPKEESASYRVSGKVFTSGNASTGGLSVDIVDKGVGGDALLARTKTDANGVYAASFSVAGVTARNKTQPDVQARVTSNSTLLGFSTVRYNASLFEVLDVQLDEKAAAGLRSEYEALTATLGIHFMGKLADLKETEQQKDITYLANKSGWDARAVALAALSDQLSTATAIPGAASQIAQPYFYALLRAGLPGNAQTLLRTDAATLQRVWTQASDQGLIPAVSADELKAVTERFQKAGANQLLTGAAVAGVSSMGSMLDVAGLDQANKELFAARYLANREDPVKLWQDIGAALGEPVAKKLQSFGKLGFMTANNSTLMRSVSTIANGAIIADPEKLMAQLAQNGFYRSEAWTQLLTTDVPVPNEIPGETAEVQRDNYAQFLAAQVRLSEPTASVAQMIKNGEVPLAPAGAPTDGVHKFLSDHQADFDLGSQPVRQYIANRKLTVDDGVAKNLQRLQRVYQITPNDTAMAGLLKRGVDAAQTVVRYDRDTFIANFSQDLGSDAAAATTHDRAVQVHNAVLNVVVSYLHARTAPPVGVHSPPAAIDPVPANTVDIVAGATLEKIFGSMDFCACSHCRSILSPAAYLVDLLMFLDHPIPPTGTQNPQDVLLRRRPDIQHLPLTCDNTNTALPYVDLVNETLEYFIANTTQALSLDDYHGHDTEEAATEDLLASPRFVMDSAYTTLQAETFPPALPFHRPLESLRRLFAKFEVPLPQAMETLRTDDALERANDASYGWRDVWMEELGMSRGEYTILTDTTKVSLQAMFGLPAATAEADARAALANVKGLARRLDLVYYDLLDILRTRFFNPAARLLPRLEKLGVSFTAMKALKDQTIADAVFDGLLGNGPDAPDPADFGGDIKAWIRDADNYADIMSLVTLVVPAQTWTAVRTYAAGDIVWPATPTLGSTIYFECTTAGSSGGAEPAWPELAGVTASDGSVVWKSRDAADCSTFDHLALRYTDPAQLGTDISAADYIRLLRFVRLWKKLGWTIEQTDAALCALFTPGTGSFERADCDTSAKLDSGFLLALPRLGHLARVITRLNLTPPRDLLPLLACFAPMTTFDATRWTIDEEGGRKRVAQPSLYRQLFLNPALLAQDAAFADNGFGEFLVPVPPAVQSLLAPHAEAVRTACNLTSDEYDRITAALAFDATTPLTIATLTAIYRRGWLARKMKLSVRELLLLSQLTKLDPFAADSAARPTMLSLIDLVEALRARALPVNVAAYLIWNQDLSSRSKLPPERIAALARTVRTSLSSIETALKVADDPDGSVVQDRLSLVYGNDAATLLVGLLNGTASSSTTYSDDEAIFAPGGTGAAVGAAAGNTDAGSPRITYDEFGKELVFAGVLTPAIATAMKSVAGAGTPKFGAAVDELLVANKAITKELFHRYPELETACDIYIADATHSPAEKRSVMLQELLPELVERRKRQQTLQVVSADAGTDIRMALALLDAPAAPYPLHASANPARPVLDDLLAVETTGLSVQFFANTTANGATIVAPDVAAMLDYSTAPAGIALPSNGAAVISGVWSGYLEAPETGIFNLRIDADNGAAVKLRFDDQDVTLTQTGTLWVNSTEISLRAGALYPIALQVESVKDSLRVQWEWQPKGQGRAVIPSRYLYPATAFRAFQAAHLRFLKASALAAELDITSEELRWFATGAAYRIDGNGVLNPVGDDWLNVLPSTDNLKLTGSAAAVAGELNASLLAPLSALMEFSRIKVELADQDESLLRVLADPLNATSNADSELFALTRWNSGAFAAMLARVQGTVATLDFSVFRRVFDGMSLAQTIGASAATLIEVITNQPTRDQAGALQSALRARYDAGAWRDLVKPINDEMRVLQRDALIAYILQRMPAGVDTAEKLFEYFLMDVKMEPCMLTSRIRHALSSVQLFVERCLMNLEKNVAPAALNSKQWAWMKRYRVWEANRKVYLFPENWLEPELRDDKSPFFKDIESDLLQGDITDERAEIAMLNYLSKLEEVAKLEPCGIHFIPGDPAQGKSELSHVVARTTGAQRKYFYRRQEFGYWTPWEPIKLDIEDNPVVPVVWNERLFLFWLRVHKSSPDAPMQGSSGVPGGSGGEKSLSEMKLSELKVAGKADAETNTKVSYRVVLCWSEYFNGKWQATRTSDVAKPIKLLEDSTGAFDRTKIRLSALFWTKGALRMIAAYGSSGVSFMLHNAHSLPENRDLKKEPHFNPKRSLELETAELRVLYAETNVTSVVLNNSLTDVGVQPNHPVDGSAWHPPFLYHDARHAFYVTTSEELVWVRDWGGFGVDTTLTNYSPFIPAIVTVPPGVVPDPVKPLTRQPRFGVVDPSPIERFVTEDAYISRGIGTPGTVQFGGAEIGLTGSVAQPARTR